MSTHQHSQETGEPVQSYPCPECGSVYAVHTPHCTWKDRGRDEIERAYVDILSTLSVGVVTRKNLTEEHVPEWSELHDDVYSHLVGTQQVIQEGDGSVRLATHEESHAPTEDPLRTIYIHGTYPGCHDNGLFALIAYWSNMGLSWQETKTQALEWFSRTGTWKRSGFAESAPGDVIEKKKHVWEEQYGWSRLGKAAKEEIDKHR